MSILSWGESAKQRLWVKHTMCPVYPQITGQSPKRSQLTASLPGVAIGCLHKSEVKAGSRTTHEKGSLEVT